MDKVKLELELRHDEGVKFVPYKDSRGILTVGVGHNLEAKPLPPNTVYPLSQEQVSMIAQFDINETVRDLLLAMPWVAELDEVRQRVLANMAFNLGVNKLLQFVNTLSAVRAKRWEQAAAGMEASRWAAQVGNRAKRLAQAMRTGVMPPLQ